MARFKYNGEGTVEAYGAKFSKGKAGAIREERLVAKARANPDFTEVKSKK